MAKILQQEDYKKDASKGLKVLAGLNTVIHCHHYNSRLQRTIEGNPLIDGKKIIRESAANVYYTLLKNLIEEKGDKYSIELASDLYSFLGFGTLDFSRLEEGVIRSDNSHFVQGWQCGAIQTKGKVCRMTEGFIEGALKAIFGQDTSVEESDCMNEGVCDCCEFQVTQLERPKNNFQNFKNRKVSFDTSKMQAEAVSNVDKQTIIDAVINMPLEGNNEGLIPAFNVYLAHTPQDFYNLVSIKFVKEMTLVGLKEVAEEMLVEDAEHCALNTFGGILDSEEWYALIRPMVKTPVDKVFGLVAVANALGWGRINVLEHESYNGLRLASANGYEAHGYLEFEGFNNEAQCFMLKGVAAGLMGLVYERGDLEDRAGKYIGVEDSCLTQEKPCCSFYVKQRA